MNEKYIQTLRTLIQTSCKCPTRYSQTIKVKEEAEGKVLFEGNVELFDLGGHPTARQCFAWGTKREDGRMEYTTILNPPAKSAAEAVRLHLQRQQTSA
jgi:hypothetical protein